MIIAVNPTQTFSPAQQDRYDLQTQIFNVVCQVALNKDIIKPDLLDKFCVTVFGVTVSDDLTNAGVTKDELERERAISLVVENSPDKGAVPPEIDREEAHRKENLLDYAIKFRAAKDADEQKRCFTELQNRLKLSNDELNQLADLMNLLVPAMNAANATKEWVMPDNDPQEIFREYIFAGLSPNHKGQNAYGMAPEEWLKKAVDTKDKMILALCNTCHPTNFYSDFGRKYQKDMYSAVYKKDVGYSGLLNGEDLAGVAKVVGETCDGMKGGKHITFLRQVTVGEEQATEFREVLPTQKEAKDQVLKKWNLAVTDVQKVKPDFTAKLNPLLLSDEDKERVYKQHSWNYATADGDGRHLANDTAMYKGYKDALDKDGKYDGPIMDCRQNAEDRKKVIGALIAARFIDRKEGARFKELCKEFNTNAEVRVKEFGGEEKLGEHFDMNGNSIFQLLSEKNQSAFLRYLMAKGEDIFDKEHVRTETIGFNEAYFEVMESLLKKYEGTLPISDTDGKPPLSEYTPFSDLIYYLPKKEEGIPGTLLDVFIAKMLGNGFELKRVISKLNGVEPELQPIVGFTYHSEHKTQPAILNQKVRNPAFNSKEEPSENNPLTKPLDRIGAMTCMAYVRRLFLLDTFITEQKDKHPDAIVARVEETANFEKPSDFFAHLYLFQQAGLVTLGKDQATGETVVTEPPKLGICPLLETTADLRDGIGVLKEILDTRLGESYYRQRGHADLFVGYSDGCKSGGNFAAHFMIRKFKKEAIELFKEKFGPDFEVVVKHGTGRGENRGGMRRYDRQYRMHHDVSNASAYNYQTIQGDHMIRMQMDQQYAQRTMAELYVSTMAGAIEAVREKSPVEIKRNESFEAAMSYIADKAEAAFQENVFKKTEEGTVMMDAIYKNAEASSRLAVRSETAQKGIGPQRAIPVEMAAFIAQLPFHDVGLKKALEEYARDPNPILKDKEGNEIRDKDGNPISAKVLAKDGVTELHGMDALKVLAQDCDFFREEMKLAAIRQQGYKPAIAELWEEKAIRQAKNPDAQKEFFSKIHADLDGLDKLCQLLLAGKETEAPAREDYSGEPYTNALGDIGQAMFSMMEFVKNAATKKLPPEVVQLANKVYFAAMGPGTEKPSSQMRSRGTPGLSDSHAQSFAVSA